MNELEKLIAQRNKAIANMRTMLDSGLNTPEDEATYERYEKEEQNLSKNISRAEKLAETEKVMAEVRETPTVATQTQREVPTEEKDAEYKRGFESMLRSGIHDLDAQTRAVLNTGVAAEGGYLVPEVYVTTVINKLLERSVMRQNSTVVRTTSTTNIPLGDGRPTFSIIAENGAYPDTDASFAQKVLNAYKLGGTIKVSDELLMDSFTNIETYLTGLITEGIADAEETYFTTGTGTGQSEGIITGSALGKTTVAIAAVTTDEVLDFIYSVNAVYRVNGKLMMNSQTELALRKLKDTNGQYLWQPSLLVGAPNVFDGKPIIINEKMPSIGTGNKFMGFGDMSYYQIADRGGIEIKRLGELYAANGQVGYRTNKRFDAKLLISETYKHMANA